MNSSSSNMPNLRRRSVDMLTNSKPSHTLSACNANRRTTVSIHPLSQGPQEINSNMILSIRKASKTCLTEFTQRVMSGKLLQLKQYQNQLAEALSSLQTAKEENRQLARLIKRQEIALCRKVHIGENAGMPRLLRAHSEEVKMLRMSVHKHKSDLRSVQAQLRERETEVVGLKDSLTKLRALAEETNVFDKAKANRREEELKNLLEEQRKEIQMLSRQLLLQSKNHQRILNTEMRNHQETKRSLDDSLTTISRLEKEKRTLLLGYSTSSRPTAHHCSPPVNKDQAEVSISWVRRKSVTPSLSQTDTKPKCYSFQPGKHLNTPTI